MPQKSKTNIVLLIILSMVALPQLATDLYPPSLPAITRGLNTDPHIVQLTIAFYM